MSSNKLSCVKVSVSSAGTSTPFSNYSSYVSSNK